MTVATDSSCYIFGIVPIDAADVALDQVADPEAAISNVRVVRSHEVGALVGSLKGERPLGRVADLRAHDRTIAAAVAAGIPILPFRFGAVVASEEAVTDELLEPFAADFQQALERVRGRVQYTVKAAYEEEAALRQVLREHPEIAALRQGADAGGTANQLRLGEAVVHALERMRPADSEELLGQLGGNAVVMRIFDPAAPDEVLNAAALVDAGAAWRFEQAVEDCGRRWAGRMHIRLVGPVAPYDFVPEQ